MKFKGGYNIRLSNRPSSEVTVSPETNTLYLPLKSRRFHFSEVHVQEGDRVQPGSVVAVDPENFGVPLLAPRAGTVSLDAAEDHIVIRNVSGEPDVEIVLDEQDHAPETVHNGEMRQKLLRLGAWQFFADAHTGALPDPFGKPRGVIVSTVQFEPFIARGSVELARRMDQFARGLEHLQRMLDYQLINVVIPETESDLGGRLREKLKGYAAIKIVLVPLRYPFDNPALIARRVGLAYDPDQPVWAIPAAGVLAIDRALTLSKPSTVRLITLGGPGVESPCHVKTIPGYPLKKLISGHETAENVRILNGGALTGDLVGSDQLGLDTECRGLTFIPETKQRELLSFMRPGTRRATYSNCFLSSILPVIPLFNTCMGGERRACISCGFCEEVCPAGIMPHYIHKLLYRDALEEAEAARMDLCVGCGLCSYVCPSKIELRSQILDARRRFQIELAEEVQ